MADDLLTLADLIKLNDANLADLEISDLLDDAPFLEALAADEASNGTEHKYLKESGAPVVGFRAPNTGRDHSKSADTLVTISLKILDATFKADKALADAYRRGAEAYLDREAKRHLKAAFALAEKQIINGTNQDALGFTGLIQADTLNGLADEMVENAGGATGLTSVLLVRTNADGADCTVIMGQEGKIELGESVVQLVQDADGKDFPAYVTPITGWLGLQIGSKYSVARICNIDDSTHKLDDEMIYRALARFPATRQPNLLVMNRRSLKQLRASRTATNATGAPAPRPTDVEGIPIVVTDGLTNAETAVA